VRPQHESVRRYRERHRAAGLCRDCPEPRAEGSKTFCVRCLAKHREDARKRYASGAQKLAKVRYEEKHEAAGLCRACPRPVRAGTTKCEHHHELQRRAREKRRELRRMYRRLAAVPAEVRAFINGQLFGEDE
jgi:hypothetical protein